MKNIYRALIVSIFCIAILPLVSNFVSVKAEYKQDYSHYNFACSLKYEVDYINDDGSFKKIDCYDDFNKAKNKMHENQDYVIRRNDGYSPTRIVAMNSGLAYSFNRSSTDVVINIYEGVKGLANNTETYVDRYFQMNYIDTNYMSETSSGTGYIHVNLGGFDGYADLEYTDLVPSKYIDKHIPIYLGGPYGGVNKEPYRVVIEPDYYIVKKNGNYNDLVLYYHNAYSSTDGGTIECWHMNVGNARDFSFLKEGVQYYSPDSVNFYSDYRLEDKSYVGTGYNYYQYLPLRTKTNISSSTIDNFLLSVKGNSTSSIIKNKAAVFMNGQNTYGSNAAIVYAMACWESSYGTSNIAVSKNNLFGWKAYDSDPSQAYKFTSVDDCILEHAGGNLRDYSDVNVKWFNGAYLGNKGSGFNLKYASDPYWGAGIASIYYKLDKYSCNNNGSLTDYDTYKLGIINTLGEPIYLDSSCTKKLFDCKYSDTRNLNYIVTVLQDCGSTYKVQVSNPVTNGQIITRVDGKYAYDWNNSVGYVKKNKLDLIGVVPTREIQTDYEGFAIVSDVKLNGNNLEISGLGAINNFDFDNKDFVNHKVEILSVETMNIIDTINCELVDTSWFDINDGYSYKYAGFKTKVDLSKYPIGSYYFKLLTQISSNNTIFENESLLYNYNDSMHLRTSKANNKSYVLETNDVYGYRFELNINPAFDNLDLGNISKPSNRTSLVTIEKAKFDENGFLNINGIGMIYYTNNNGNVEHNLYLINDSQAIKIDAITSKSDFNYKEFYGSSYNMDNICYKASIDCSKLDGTYYLVLEIKNGEYTDYVELTNRYNKTYDNLKLNKLSADIITSDIRYRLNLKVKKG